MYHRPSAAAVLTTTSFERYTHTFQPDHHRPLILNAIDWHGPHADARWGRNLCELSNTSFQLPSNPTRKTFNTRILGDII